MKLNGKIILCYGKCCEEKYLKKLFFNWLTGYINLYNNICVEDISLLTNIWRKYTWGSLTMIQKNSKKKLRHINMIIGNRFYVISDHIKWKSL